jgi:hypothetical protein
MVGLGPKFQSSPTDFQSEVQNTALEFL